MCTLILSYQESHQWPLFVAGNRDEFYARPTRAPELHCEPTDSGLREDEPVPAGPRSRPVAWLGPSDALAGGTWIGVNTRRLVAVLTNRTDQPPRGSEPLRSRGALVRRLLECSTASAALAILERDAHNPSAPFNLVFGTVDELFLAERTEQLRVDRLSPGSIAISNYGAPGDLEVGEVRRASREWDRLFSSRLSNRALPHAADGGGEPPDPFAVGAKILGASKTTDDGPTLVKRGNPDRGTRSSTLIGIDHRGGVRFDHRDLDPDTPTSPHYISYPLPSS